MHSISPAISTFSIFSGHHHLRRTKSYHSPPPSSHQQTTKTLLHHHHHHHSHHQNIHISAIHTAVQPFNNESKPCIHITKSKTLKIAIIGFGNFAQFLAKTLVHQGHTVLAYSRTDYSVLASNLGVLFYTNADDLCEEHPDVILLCTSILSTDKVLRSLPLQRLKRSTLFVDVLSVKEFAKDLLLNILPLDFDILCTHPMFGPESGKYSWNNLSFVYDKVRIGSEESRVSRCKQFLNIFATEGCVMKEMSCAEHDQHAAESQFITHTVGRILEKLKLESTPINTKGYEKLLDLVGNTSSDSFELYYGLFMYNKNAMEQLERLDFAFESLKKELFGHLHEVLRKQLYVKRECGLLPPPVLALALLFVAFVSISFFVWDRQTLVREHEEEILTLKEEVERLQIELGELKHEDVVSVKKTNSTTTKIDMKKMDGLATDPIEAERREKVKDAMLHAWTSYEKYAWGHDELQPQTKNGVDSFGGLGATLIDSLDTLYIMGLDEQFQRAREWVADSLDFNKNYDASVFETTIRLLHKSRGWTSECL